MRDDDEVCLLDWRYKEVISWVGFAIVISTLVLAFGITIRFIREEYLSSRAHKHVQAYHRSHSARAGSAVEDQPVDVAATKNMVQRPNWH